MIRIIVSFLLLSMAPMTLPMLIVPKENPSDQRKNYQPEIEGSFRLVLLVPEIEKIACSVSESPYAKNVAFAQIVAIPEDALKVAHKYNIYFSRQDNKRIDVTRDEYNATVNIPFEMRKNYRNETRFFKAVVKADFSTKVKRVVVPTACGAAVGAVCGGIFEVGFQHANNVQAAYAEIADNKIEIFNDVYRETYNNVYNETYSRVVLEKANPAGVIVQELQFVPEQTVRGGIDSGDKDVIGRSIYQGGVSGVEQYRANAELINNDPELLQENLAIQRTLMVENVGSVASDEAVAFGFGTFSGFCNGVFRKSYLDHHEAAMQIAANTATIFALQAANAAINSIPVPTISVNISSGKELQDRCLFGALWGAGAGLMYSLWNINKPVIATRISEINKPI